MPRSFTLLLFLLCSLTISWPDAWACTSLRIRTSDGLVFYARTMEGEWTLQTVMGVVPPGTPFQGTLPDGTSNGAKWQAKYAFVGMFDFGVALASDGMNEKGLVVGQLFLPGYAAYERYDPAKSGETLAQYEFGTWLLAKLRQRCRGAPGLSRRPCLRGGPSASPVPCPCITWCMTQRATAWSSNTRPARLPFTTIPWAS